MPTFFIKLVVEYVCTLILKQKIDVFMFNKTLDRFCLRHWLQRNTNDLEKPAESFSDSG